MTAFNNTIYRVQYMKDSNWLISGEYFSKHYALKKLKSLKLLRKEYGKLTGI